MSGGKDSLFSILHCLQNGHQVVALANLHPPVTRSQNADEDMDSFMYQTVGHSTIPLYEQALGLPLYRQEINGQAVNQSKSYSQRSEMQDETESLVPLLQKVKKQHPTVNAVSTGAILSDYQRTRVESVAIRLGLTPLAYLWQWPNIPPHTQTTLLENMAAVGQDSRVIKVASGGLDSSFLWSNVAEPRTMSRIDKAVGRFGSGDDGAALGEGGEYETLAIDGPAPLWKGRIEVKADVIEVVPGDAGTASVSIRNARIVELDVARNHIGVHVPQMLEPQFVALMDELQRTINLPPVLRHISRPCASLHDHVCYRYVTGEGSNIVDQTQSIMNALAIQLQQQDPSSGISGIAYVSIILADMGDFAVVNKIYSDGFTEANPPARITLAEPSVLPAGKEVMMSFTCFRGLATRKTGLHVQSQSYWAPANIGPYSQAISLPLSGEPDEHDEHMPHVVYIAGQIPLVPASMDLYARDASAGAMWAFENQTVLAAQHFVRIGRAMHVRQWVCGIAFIVAMSDEEALDRARRARRVWEAVNQPSGERKAEAGDSDSEPEDFDVWHVRHGVQRSLAPVRDAHADTTPACADGIPFLAVVSVDALPRGACIEWATYGLTATQAEAPAIPPSDHLLEVFKDRVVLTTGPVSTMPSASADDKNSLQGHQGGLDQRERLSRVDEWPNDSSDSSTLSASSSDGA